MWMLCVSVMTDMWMLVCFSDDSHVDVVVVFQSLIVRDTVRECLEKDPAERTEDDIEVLLDFLQHLLVSNRSLCGSLRIPPPPVVVTLGLQGDWDFPGSYRVSC